MDLKKLFKGTGRVIKLTNSKILVGHQYNILAYQERKGKYGIFYHLWCEIYSDDLKNYQRIFSNKKLTNYLFNHPNKELNYDVIDPHTQFPIFQLNSEGEKNPICFHPAGLNYFNGIEYREIL